MITNHIYDEGRREFSEYSHKPTDLWTLANRPEEYPLSPEDAREAREKQIRLLARELFPEGLEGQITDDRPTYDHSVAIDGARATTDILVPSSDGWDLVAVTTSSRVSSTPLHDLAYQVYCYERAGYRVNRCHVVHIDKSYVREGDLNPTQLFTREDVTDSVREKYLPHVQDNLARIREVIGWDSPPRAPEEEPLPDDAIGKLWTTHFSRNNALRDMGFQRVSEIPLDLEYAVGDKKLTLTPGQKIQIELAQDGKMFVDRKRLLHLLSRVKFPIVSYDMETIMLPEPMYSGVKVNQQILFQHALGIWYLPGDSEDDYEYREFLADEREGDFRVQCLDWLAGNCRDVWHGIWPVYSSFETQRYNEMAKNFPEREEFIKMIQTKFFDIFELGLKPRRKDGLPPVFYHPWQRFKASLKDFTNVFADFSYSGSAIENGGVAMNEMIRLIMGGLPEERRLQIRDDLGFYVTKDVENPLHVLKGLMWIAQEGFDGICDVPETGFTPAERLKAGIEVDVERVLAHARESS